MGRPRLGGVLVLAALSLPACISSRDVVVAGDAPTTVATLPARTLPATGDEDQAERATTTPTTTTAVAATAWTSRRPVRRRHEATQPRAPGRGCGGDGGPVGGGGGTVGFVVTGLAMTA